MNLWHRIKEQKHMTSSDRKLSAYLLHHPDTIRGLSSRELARCSGVSAASVIRFCHRLGYESYQEFKVALLVALESQHTVSPLKPSTTTYGLMQQVAELSRQVIEKTQATISYQQMDRAVEYILKASQVDLYGRGMNRQLLEMEKYHFVRIGIQASQEEFRNARFSQALNADASHVALMISHRGHTPEYLHIAHELKRKGIPLILLCGMKDSPLAELADILFEIDIGSYFEEMSTIVFKMSAGYVLDTLFAIALAKKGNQLQEKLTAFENLAHYLDH